MKIALIAHDKKKEDLSKFVSNHKSFFSKNDLLATASTGQMIKENCSLGIKCFLSGPLGGDQQIGSEISSGGVDMVIFFRDPLTAQPHEPDISALIRICDVYNIPIATNLGTAEMFMNALTSQ